MKSINTLIPDIYETVKKNGWFGADEQRYFHTQLSRSLNQEERVPGLSISMLGPKCPKQLWHSVHTPELAEPLQPWARIKFTYGYVIEALVLSMARASGHTVTGEQDELVLDGVKGHRDCVVDGCIVDVKSASSRMFQKFRERNIEHDDPFGYLDQLDGYLVASADDPCVLVKDKAYILAVDKTLGHMVLHEHQGRGSRIRERVKRYREIVERNNPPDCMCGTQTDGRSGNIRLDVKASYSSFKHTCFPDLRTFLYSSGPVYLTKVIRKPDVPEVDKNGKYVYN